MSDPPSGEVPFQPWARSKAAEFAAHLSNPMRPEYVEPLARCAPAGPTKSFMWHGYEIRQYPGYVVFLFDSGTRVIHLGDSPHLPASIKLWNGDSRGHWEGNTLVVDVANNNSKARLARTGEFASEHVRIQERYIFDAGGERFTYKAVYTDPTVFTRPFTVTIPNRRITAATPQDGWNNVTFRANHPGLRADHRGLGAGVRREQRSARRHRHRAMMKSTSLDEPWPPRVKVIAMSPRPGARCCRTVSRSGVGSAVRAGGSSS